MFLLFFHFLAASALAVAAETKPANFRMVGGDHATISDYPPLVNLALYHPPEELPDTRSRIAPSVIADGYEHFCGGTIVHPQWVLTAAHCLDDKMDKHENLRVLVGFSDLSPGKPLLPGEAAFYVEDVVLHPEYSKKFLLSDDVALIKIKTDFGPREVAALETSADADLIGKQATTFGWGSTDATGSTGSSLHLLKLTEKIYDPPEDLEIGIEMRDKGTHNDLKEQLIFLGTEPERGACHGDSGGPLVLSENKKLIGVTSFVNETCGGFSFFQRVSRHISWIETNTGDKVNGTDVALGMSYICLALSVVIVVLNASKFDLKL